MSRNHVTFAPDMTSGVEVKSRARSAGRSRQNVSYLLPKQYGDYRRDNDIRSPDRITRFAKAGDSPAGANNSPPQLNNSPSPRVPQMYRTSLSAVCSPALEDKGEAFNRGGGRRSRSDMASRSYVARLRDRYEKDDPPPTTTTSPLQDGEILHNDTSRPLTVVLHRAPGAPASLPSPGSSSGVETPSSDLYSPPYSVCSAPPTLANGHDEPSSPLSPVSRGSSVTSSRSSLLAKLGQKLRRRSSHSRESLDRASERSSSVGPKVSPLQRFKNWRQSKSRSRSRSRQDVTSQSELSLPPSSSPSVSLPPSSSPQLSLPAGGSGEVVLNGSDAGSPRHSSHKVSLSSDDGVDGVNGKAPPPVGQTGATSNDKPQDSIPHNYAPVLDGGKLRTDTKGPCTSPGYLKLACAAGGYSSYSQYSSSGGSPSLTLFTPRPYKSPGSASSSQGELRLAESDDMGLLKSKQQWNVPETPPPHKEKRRGAKKLQNGHSEDGEEGRTNGEGEIFFQSVCVDDVDGKPGVEDDNPADTTIPYGGAATNGEAEHHSTSPSGKYVLEDSLEQRLSPDVGESTALSRVSPAGVSPAAVNGDGGVHTNGDCHRDNGVDNRCQDSVEAAENGTKDIVEDTKDIVEDTQGIVEDTKDIVEETKSIVQDTREIPEVQDATDIVADSITAQPLDSGATDSVVVPECSPGPDVSEKEEVAEEPEGVAAANAVPPPQTNGVESSVDEEDQRAGPRYLRIMEAEAERMSALCRDMESSLPDEGNVSEEAAGKVRAAVGKSQLLTTKKFKQFRGLCHKNLTDEPDVQFRTTEEDLAGFWDMVMIQVEDVDALFVELDKLRANGWKVAQKTSAKVKKPAAKGSAAGTSKAPGTGSGDKTKAQRDAQARRQEARKRLMAAKKAAAQRKSSESGGDEGFIVIS